MAESPIQSSFIPRDAAAPSRAAPQSGGLYDLLMLISIVLFVASLALAVGVFLYMQYLQAASASKLGQLERAKAAFEPSLIQTLTRLDDRMRSADDLLSAHIAPTAFLSALEQTTLQTVSFRSLDFQGGDPEQVTIKMAGVAQSVNSIALQADLFSKSNIITDPIFSGIARQTDGVDFDVAAYVKTATIRYASLLSSGNATVGGAAGNSSPFTSTTAQGQQQGVVNSVDTQAAQQSQNTSPGGPQQQGQDSKNATGVTQ